MFERRIMQKRGKSYCIFFSFIKIFVFSLVLGILILTLLARKFLEPLKKILASINIVEVKHQKKDSDFDVIEKIINIIYTI